MNNAACRRASAAMTASGKEERAAFLKLNPRCARPGCGAPATLVDHIIPHKGDQRLFWSRSNWQPLAPPVIADGSRRRRSAARGSARGGEGRPYLVVAGLLAGAVASFDPPAWLDARRPREMESGRPDPDRRATDASPRPTSRPSPATAFPSAVSRRRPHHCPRRHDRQHQDRPQETSCRCDPRCRHDAGAPSCRRAGPRLPSVAPGLPPAIQRMTGRTTCSRRAIDHGALDLSAWIFDGSEIADPMGRGERAVRWLGKLKHPKSPLPGKPFQLDPWQERIVRAIYGPRHEDGTRIVKTVVLLLPRGNRKTSLAAALALLHTIGPEKGAGRRGDIGRRRSQAGTARLCRGAGHRPHGAAGGRAHPRRRLPQSADLPA